MKATGSATDPPKLAFIDALRGAAVTLVIASHSFPVLHNLPWAIKRLTNLGFYGVQLFFVVSCFTLAGSWRQRQARTGRPPGLGEFALRRAFRIIPAYFLAALFYLVMLPGPTPGWQRIATFVTFASGWSPAQMPTLAGAWIGVPGGWSIEAEMAFYVLFPLLVMTLRGVAAPLAACIISLPLAWAANTLAHAAYLPAYGETATGQFLYYWLPNQLCVFLLGLATYAAATRLAPQGDWARVGDRMARHAGKLLTVCALCFAALAYLPWPRLPEPGRGFVPAHVLAAACFAGAALVLSRTRLPRPAGVLAWLGQASFSAYLLHFAVIEAVRAALPPRVLDLSGVPAAAAASSVFLVVIAATALTARITYRFVEQPGIAMGAHVAKIQWRER